MSRGIADTSLFIARESGRTFGEHDLLDELAISVIRVLRKTSRSIRRLVRKEPTRPHVRVLVNLMPSPYAYGSLEPDA